MNKLKLFLISLALLVILAGVLLIGSVFGDDTGYKGVTVRVQKTPGGPQIHVNGKPVPPRFFWGEYNTGTIILKPEWTSHSFEFMPGEVNGTGTLKFNFLPGPGEIWLADLHIQDAKTEEDVLLPGTFATQEDFAKSWNFSHVDTTNTVGTVTVSDNGLHIVLKGISESNRSNFINVEGIYTTHAFSTFVAATQCFVSRATDPTDAHFARRQIRKRSSASSFTTA